MSKILKNQPRDILLVDLEVSPIIGYAYGRWETNLIDVDHEQHLQSFAYKWLGEKKVYCYAQPDFPAWEADRFDDSELAKKLWEVMNKASIIVAHNARKFDVKQANTAFRRNDIGPPHPYKVIDTLQLAKKYFKFSSNKLDELGKQLKVGRKLEKDVPQLWKRCMNGDKQAWRFMKAYNIQDVVLLEKIYNKFIPWLDSFPVYKKVDEKCECGSNVFLPRGYRYLHKRKATFRELRCARCGRWKLGEQI